MRVIRTINELQAELAPHRTRLAGSIGLVATMGFFHEGHLSLMRAAASDCDLVVVSLFVNPTQFRPGEDLDSYPSNFVRDCELAEQAGADLLFAPDNEEIYPDQFHTQVSVSDLTEVLCGSHKRRGPEHFHGVTTVVAKLFNIVQPDVAFFGQKDAQQVLVIERMVQDLNFPVELRVLPTVRERDGLAMSSRNSYLSQADRARAASLYKALLCAERLIKQGERDSNAIKGAAAAELARAAVEIEYLEIVAAKTLQPVEALHGEILIAVAARVGETRLIDNIRLDVPSEPVTHEANKYEGSARALRSKQHHLIRR